MVRFFFFRPLAIGDVCDGLLYGHKLSNAVLFAHHLILDAPGGSSHLGYRRRVPPGHNPTTRVNRSGGRRAPIQEAPPIYDLAVREVHEVYQPRPFPPPGYRGSF